MSPVPVIEFDDLPLPRGLSLTVRAGTLWKDLMPGTQLDLKAREDGAPRQHAEVVAAQWAQSLKDVHRSTFAFEQDPRRRGLAACEAELDRRYGGDHGSQGYVFLYLWVP